MNYALTEPAAWPMSSEALAIKYELTAACPALKERVVHPVRLDKWLLRHIIPSLNDDHKWSRERIADWLETLDLDISFVESPV